MVEVMGPYEKLKGYQMYQRKREKVLKEKGGLKSGKGLYTPLVPSK